MSESVVIVGTELILTSWQVLAVCSGLNQETGGTMSVSVFFDPELDPEVRAPAPSADEYRKYFSDPETIALAMKQAQPRVRRSAQIRPILALEFASRAHDPFYDWVLDQKIGVLLPWAVKAVQKMGRPEVEAAAFLADLLSSLGQLNDWAQVNRRRFAGCRILVDAEVAEKLSLSFEGVPEQSGKYVPIHVRRFV